MFCYMFMFWVLGFSLEWLYGLDIDFGLGWDLIMLEIIVFIVCMVLDGNWNWYENWESCNINDIFGLGFVFDSKRGLLCFGVIVYDGLFGNNFGDGFCGNFVFVFIDFEFCWMVCVWLIFNNVEEVNFNLSIMMFGDGMFGLWMMESCVLIIISVFFVIVVLLVSV